MRKDLRPGMIKAGGMKLDELHVGHGRAGAIGHGHAVARGNVRVGGVKINFAAAARGQERTERAAKASTRFWFLSET